MHGLEQGITQLANYGMNQTVRSNAVTLLNGIIDDLNEGIKVWKEFQSGNANAKPGSYGGWAGFTIESKLWELELDARDKAKEASNGRSSLDQPLIVLAYTKLEEGQTASEKCNSAVEEMKNRINTIQELIALIKNTKPKKESTAAATTPKAAKKSSTAKTPAKKKSAKKKSTKKKQAAKKKPAKKKKAAKKSTKKKAVKKKAGKKKAVKKKSSKKKAAKKKTTKKKPAKKKAKRR